MEEQVIPAEYETVTRQVIKSPATFNEEVIPAEYESITRQVVSNPASTQVVNIPAEYSTISKRTLVKKGGFTEWREVLCNTEITSFTIRQVQQALKDKGYDPGPVDGVMGVRTKSALTQYQKDRGLPVGQLDLETLNSLGVQY